MAMDRKRRDEADEDESRYGNELLSANWNPVLALLEWSCARTSEETSRDRVREEDADAFLGRFYNLGG
jgi:hypothetical protein